MKLSYAALLLITSLATSLTLGVASPSALAGPGATLTPNPQPAPVLAERDRGLPLRWGVGFDMDRPFYRPGEVARVSLHLVNTSAQDAYGWAPSGGGSGCQFAVTITDLAGDVVYEPGRIRGGVFSGQPCFFRELTWNLPSHSAESLELSVPLIFQNGLGNGVLGADLPPGAYSLDLSVTFVGPKRTPSAPPFGRNFTASVPFLIEP